MKQSGKEPIAEEKMRFVENGKGLNVVFPQCVGCKFNKGDFICEALSRKPEEYISNEEKCPMHEQ